MSQQINLLLPELRPRFDWLALPLVAGVAVAGLVVLLVVGQFQAMRVTRLASAEAGISGEILNLQQQVQTLGQTVAGRKENAALRDMIASLAAAVEQRREVLAYVGQDGDVAAPAFSAMLQGFARQDIEGLWLVGFGLSHDGLEIRGRLLDPALLPRYIERLNGDPAFAGRRFAALEMKSVTPVAAKPSAGGDASAIPARAAMPPYTEFVLRTETVPVQEKQP